MMNFQCLQDIGLAFKRICCEEVTLRPALGLSRSKSQVDRMRSVKGRTMPSGLKLQLGGCSNHPCRPIDQFLNHGLEASALGGMAHRRLFPYQPVLPHDAKDIVNEAPKAQHQGVAGKLSRGQSFQVQVGLDFPMELLTEPTLFLQGDDLKIVEIRGRAPAFHLDLGLNEHLAFRIADASRDMHDQPEPIRPPIVLSLHPCPEDRNAFSHTSLSEAAFFTGSMPPKNRGDLARFPADHRVSIGVRAELPQVFQGIVGRVRAHQNRPGHKSLRASQRLCRKTL